MDWGPGKRPALWAALVSGVIYLVLGLLLLAPRGEPPMPWLRLPLSTATAASNGLTFAFLLVGWLYVRAGKLKRHRLMMELALGSISAFLVLYVTRQYLVGTIPFGGPEALYLYFYLPLLLPHLAISATCIPPVVYNFTVGLTRELGEVGSTLHPRVGRIVVPLWLLSSSMGLVVFALLLYFD